MVPMFVGAGEYGLATGVIVTAPNENRTYTQVLTLYLKTK
jgi:hypothetical protein